MGTERTPEERAEEAAADARVEQVIEETVNNVASWKLAEYLDLDAETCENLLNACYRDLTTSLTEYELTRAVMLLIDDEASDLTIALLRGLKNPDSILSKQRHDPFRGK